MIGEYLTLKYGPTLFAVLAVVVIAFGIIVATACLSLLVHHVISSRRRRQRAALVARAIKLLAPAAVHGDELSLSVDHARRKLGDGAVAEVLRRARIEIKGKHAEALSRELTRIGEVERLRREADSRRLWRRRAAVRGLGECGGELAREALLRAAQDPEPDVRRAARDGLLNDGRPESIQAAIRSFLADVPRNYGWRREFYARLGACSPSALLELTTSVGLSTHEEKLGLEALGDIQEPKALGYARSRLSAKDPEMRATAARVLGKLQDAESGPVLAKLLDDPEWYVRAAGAKAFEQLPPNDEYLRILGQKLTDPAWWVRANAAKALAQKGAEGADVLMHALEGSDRFAQQTAIAALSRVGLPPALRTRLAAMLPRLAADPQTSRMTQLMQAAPGGVK